MAYEKLAKLVTLISKKTRDGELKWEATAREDAFQVAFPDYVVQIVRPLGQAEGEEITLYVLRILNARNIVIEEVMHYDLNENFTDAHGLMSELYAAARRQALGVEKALDTLLETLEKAKPPPLPAPPRIRTN